MTEKLAQSPNGLASLVNSHFCRAKSVHVQGFRRNFGEQRPLEHAHNEFLHLIGWSRGGTDIGIFFEHSDEVLQQSGHHASLLVPYPHHDARDRLDLARRDLLLHHEPNPGHPCQQRPDNHRYQNHHRQNECRGPDKKEEETLRAPGSSIG